MRSGLGEGGELRRGEGAASFCCVYVLESVGDPVLPGGCALGLSGSISAPPSPSLLFPFPTVGLQAAVTPVGFLQPGPRLVQLRHRLPGSLSQSHLPGGEPACSLRAAPSWLLPTPRLRWFLGVLQVKRSLKSRPLEVRRFPVHLGPLGHGGQGFNEQLTRVSNPVLYLHGIWAYSRVKA